MSVNTCSGASVQSVWFAFVCCCLFKCAVAYVSVCAVTWAFDCRWRDADVILWNSSGLPVHDLNVLFKNITHIKAHRHTCTHLDTHTRRGIVPTQKNDRGWKWERMKDRVDHLKGNTFWLNLTYPLHPHRHTYTPSTQLWSLAFCLIPCDITACRKTKVHLNETQASLLYSDHSATKPGNL